ncbi:MAG TPA: YceI family protein [Myxococcaceae bacterium]|nr:YceI family protein [Myxococcaceae bacterium]
MTPGIVAVALLSLSVSQARVWVSGTSTVQPWKCAARAVDARIADLPAEPLTLANVTSASGGSVHIAVAALDCSNDTMNEHLRNALQAKDHPQIHFELKSYQLTPAQGGKAKLAIDGALTMGGATKAIHIDAVATELPVGKIRVTGEYALDMKDYGLKPPELFFGAMRVDPRVVVGFELTLPATQR